jgi:hypothetical protein
MMHTSQQPLASVQHYQVQERAMAPVYHHPTPSPLKRRQETLTQNEWGARPLPSGWVEHSDGSGKKYYVNRKMGMFAPTYDHMFVEEQPAEPEPEPSKNLTQRSVSSSANSQEEETYSPKKKIRRQAREVIEVGTEDLPGSDFSAHFARGREAKEAEKENDSQSQNLLDDDADPDDNNGNHNDADEALSDEATD